MRVPTNGWTRRVRSLNFAMTAAFMVLGVAPSAIEAAAQAGLRCDEILFSVAPAPDQEVDFTVVGWLCSRGPIANKTIQILVNGATYDHHYWDFPYRPSQYSYVRAATATGYATLNMDRSATATQAGLPATYST